MTSRPRAVLRQSKQHLPEPPLRQGSGRIGLQYAQEQDGTIRDPVRFHGLFSSLGLTDCHSQYHSSN